MQQTSLANEAYFIGQRSLLRLPTKPTSFFYGFFGKRMTKKAKNSRFELLF